MLPENFLTGLQRMVSSSIRFKDLSGVERVELSRAAEEILKMKKEGILPPPVEGWHAPDDEYLNQFYRRVYGGIQLGNKGEVHRAWLKRVAVWTLKIQPNITYPLV